MDKALIITKVHIIRFGGVTQQVFTFKDGINLIYGENRSGKTTLCEFIRFMYYGFEGRDPEDFYPYDSENHSVCGSMTVRFGQRTYEIFREKSPAGSVLAVTDTERSQPFRIPDDMTPGEYFMGISSALYDRSLYCPQDMAGMVSAGSLTDCEEELIAAYSGEYGFLSVSADLEKRKNLISNPERTGTIDLALAEREALEGELAAAIIKQNEIISMEMQIDEVASKMLEVEKQIVLAKADIENFHDMQVEENSRRIENARKEIEKAKAEYERLLNSGISDSEAATAESISVRYEALRRKKTELELLEERIAGSKANLDTHNEMVSAELYTDEDFEKVTERVEKREKLCHRFVIGAMSLFVTAAVVFAAVFMFREKIPYTDIIYIICGASAVISAVLLTAAIILGVTKNSLYRAVDTESQDEFEEAYEICRSRSQAQAIYRSAYEQDLRLYEERSAEYARELSAISAELDLNEKSPDPEKLSRAVAEKCVAEAKIESARKRYEEASQAYEDLGADFIVRTEKDVEKLRIREKELVLLNSQLEDLFDTKRSLESTFSTAVIHTERPSYIKTRMNTVSECIAEGYKDLTAISMALRITEDALKVMRFQIRQHLADGIRRTIKFALQENESFILDDSYSLQYKNASRIFPVFTDGIGRISRAAKGISRSLAEMAAIALRFSLIELLETDCATAILDEPFAFIDKAGEDKLTAGLADTKSVQIFLFTSRPIPENNESFNIIRMSL